MPDLQQYSPQHEYPGSQSQQQQQYGSARLEDMPSLVPLPPPDDNDLVLAVLSARGYTNNSNSNTATGERDEDGDRSVIVNTRDMDETMMSSEPSTVPPYWNFSTTRSQLLDHRPEGSNLAPSLLLPPSRSSLSSPAAASSSLHQAQQRGAGSGSSSSASTSSRHRSQSRSQQHNRVNLPNGDQPSSSSPSSTIDSMLARYSRRPSEIERDSVDQDGQHEDGHNSREESMTDADQQVNGADIDADENGVEDDDDDDDDPSKGPASGPNALPLSPPRRIRRLPHIQQVLDDDNTDENDENCIAQCPRGRCTCSRRSSPVPQGISPLQNRQSSSPLQQQQQQDGTSASTSTSPRSSSKGKRKRDISYIRTSSYLQPGIVFTGTQSFTTYATSNSSFNPVYPTPISPRETHHRRSLHPFAAAATSASAEQQQQDRLYTGGAPSRHMLASALDHLHVFTRNAAGNVRLPFSSRSPAPQQPSPSQQQHQQQEQGVDSPWSAIAGSAIDPQMQELLRGNPGFGYTSGDSIARASSTEEWEVQVSISSVDYLRGRVTGIMTALNVPNSMYSNHAVSSSIGPSSASLAGGPGSNTVTTSFEGEIIDLHNNGLWTRSSPNAAWRSMGAPEEFDEMMEAASHSSSSSSTSALPSNTDSMEQDTQIDNIPPLYVAGNSSSCTSGPWLASNQTVDKSTDLEYWAKVDAFTSFGPLAEKEICKIAREGKWPETVKETETQKSKHYQHHKHHHHARRPDPRDYILMRWKERDFIDCDARSSGLTISGFYYLCLNRKTGALSGFYYDPLSTPHQKLELQVARTRSRAGAESASVTDTQGGIWFGSYSVI